MSGSNAASPPEIRVENDKGEAAGSGLTTGQVKSDNPWAICLLVVNFDVEFGQSMLLFFFFLLMLLKTRLTKGGNNLPLLFFFVILLST